MRACPQCKEKGVSRHKLVAQHLCIPSVVATCGNCEAIVMFQESQSFFHMLVVELAFYAAMLALVFWSINHFGAVWPGLIVLVVGVIVRSYIKTTAPLDYVR